MAIKLYGNQCRKCKKTHEDCSYLKRCADWRLSYEVCIVFGTRLSKPGFRNTSVSR